MDLYMDGYEMLYIYIYDDVMDHKWSIGREASEIKQASS